MHKLIGQKDIDHMSFKELKDLKHNVEQRLRNLERMESRSLAEKLGVVERIDLIALAVKQTGIRCRILDTGEAVTLRPDPGVRNEAEAHILTVQIHKAWTYGQTTYLSGKVHNMRLDVSALRLVPLTLQGETLFDPNDEYWGEEGEPIMECFKPIIAAGQRPSFEMEQILLGFDDNDLDSDPIGQAIDLYDSGDSKGAFRIMHRCLIEDLRMLDVYAHLGYWAFGNGKYKVLVEKAQKNYEAGVAIAELSLGLTYNGVLAWGRINNRPFLRCLHGLGLCHWVLDDLLEATSIFKRMLWLNPSDNQGARFCLAEVSAGKKYEDSRL